MLAPGIHMHFHHSGSSLCFHERSLAAGCDRCSWNLTARAQIHGGDVFFLTPVKKSQAVGGGGAEMWWLPAATSFNCFSIWVSGEISFHKWLHWRTWRASGDSSSWYLRTNHLDMNYSLPNGNPYSSCSKSPPMGMQMWLISYLLILFPVPNQKCLYYQAWTVRLLILNCYGYPNGFTESLSYY